MARFGCASVLTTHRHVRTYRRTQILRHDMKWFEPYYVIVGMVVLHVLLRVMEVAKQYGGQDEGPSRL